MLNGAARENSVGVMSLGLKDPKNEILLLQLILCQVLWSFQSVCCEIQWSSLILIAEGSTSQLSHIVLRVRVYGELSNVVAGLVWQELWLREWQSKLAIFAEVNNGVCIIQAFYNFLVGGWLPFYKQICGI